MKLGNQGGDRPYGTAFLSATALARRARSALCCCTSCRNAFVPCWRKRSLLARAIADRSIQHCICEYYLKLSAAVNQPIRPLGKVKNLVEMGGKVKGKVSCPFPFSLQLLWKNYAQVETAWAKLIMCQPYYDLGRLAVLKLNLKFHYVHTLKNITKSLNKLY